MGAHTRCRWIRGWGKRSGNGSGNGGEKQRLLLRSDAPELCLHRLPHSLIWSWWHCPLSIARIILVMLVNCFVTMVMVTGRSYPWANTSLLCQWDFLRNKWPEQWTGARLDGWTKPPHSPSSGDALGLFRKLQTSADSQWWSRQGRLLPCQSTNPGDPLGCWGPCLVSDLVLQQRQQWVVL